MLPVPQKATKPEEPIKEMKEACLTSFRLLLTDRTGLIGRDLVMWLLAGITAIAVCSVGLLRSIMRRHRDQQNRSMRDHIRRIPQRPE
jgi:hypothetical protein